MIATLAWDRLLIDPLPGPRGVECFTGLDTVAEGVWVVTDATRPIAPAGSTLPRMARDLDATLLLLDPYRGVRGLTAQLTGAVSAFTAAAVTVVDVGGDVTARGDEPGLKSPTADIITLTAAAALGAIADVAVLGAGLDGELPAPYVHERICKAGGGYERTLTPGDVQAAATVFTWHPSEASGALAACAEGARGILEVRDAGLRITLSDQTPDVCSAPAAALADSSPLACALADTTDFEQVEQVVRRICGFTEMDIEREKAASLGQRAPETPGPGELAHRIAVFEQQAALRGIDYVSLRRLAEQIGAPRGPGFEAWRSALIREHPERYVRPLWSVRPR